MRYFILFSLLWFLQFALSQSTNVNPATPAVIMKAMSFASKYQYSIVPPSSSPSVLFWWTPDVAHNQIHFGVMGGENAWVGLGFNNQSAGMVPGFAVVGTPDNVTLHSLLGQFPPVVPELMDQSNIQNSSVTVQDNYLFMEFTWVMRPPVFFPVDQPVNVIWATLQGGPPNYFQQHDNQDVLSSFTFTAPQNFSGYKPVVLKDCGYGSTVGNYYSFVGTTCVCPHGFTVESNCTKSSLQYSHIFKDTYMKKDILTMYWTLNDTILDITIQSYFDPTGTIDQWAGIAFCAPDGMMGPADAVISPNMMPGGGPLSVYLSHHGADGITDQSFLPLNNTVFAQAPGYNFFSFRRILSDGKLSITDVTSVPMIAARSTSSWSSKNQHNVWSRSADQINLQSGAVKPPQFFWTNQVTHGFLMWFSWALIIPCGFLWARFIKGYPNDKSALWFEGHRTLMSIGFIIVVISGSYIIALTSTHLDATHKILGVTVLVGALYQVMSAVMRPHADPTNPSPQRLVYEYTHHFVGRATIIIAWVAIGYGLMLVPGISMSVVWGHVAISAIWLIFYFILEVRKQIIMRRNRDYESLNRR